MKSDFRSKRFLAGPGIGLAALGCLALCAVEWMTLGADVAAPEGAGGTAGASAPAGKGAEAVPEKRVIADLGIELLWIKAGTFKMGSKSDEPGRDKAEGPQMTVTLSKGFWLGKTAVTQGQYEAFTKSNPSHFKEVGKDAPVETVSWIDAKEFCDLLTARERDAKRLPEGYVYTLPTEAQWEYAYRAGSTDPYPAGDPLLTGWFEKNSDGKTHPVGEKLPNAWGLYDMAGNVLQWCRDWYGDYPGGSVTDPTGPATGHFRMARGGSWRTGSELARSAARAGGSAGRRDYTLGFRLALCAVEQPTKSVPK